MVDKFLTVIIDFKNNEIEKNILLSVKMVSAISTEIASSDFLNSVKEKRTPCTKALR